MVSRGPSSQTCADALTWLAKLLQKKKERNGFQKPISLFTYSWCAPQAEVNLRITHEFRACLSGLSIDLQSFANEVSTSLVERHGERTLLGWHLSDVGIHIL